MRIPPVVMLLLFPALASAAPKKPAPPPPADTSAYCIYGAQSGKSFHGEAAFKSIIWKSDVIYIGEEHVRAKDQLAQLEALKALKIARGNKIAVGFEMLDATFQPILDSYAAGNITEEAFLSGTGWNETWGVDFAIYKPLFDFVVLNKLKALALNIPRKIVSKAARTGLEGLDPEERRLIPEKITLPKHKKYLDYLKSAFGAQPSAMSSVFTWDNYLISMSAWNESMGARVADFVNANPGWAVLVLAGNGRVMYNAGVPASVKSRVPGVRQASFYTEDSPRCPPVFPKDRRDLANYVWFIDHSTQTVK